MTEQTVKTTTDDAGGFARKRTEASIVRVGNRGLSTDGRVHPRLITEFVKANAKNAWLPLKELTKQVTGSPAKSNRQRVVRHLPKVTRELLEEHELLILEYGDGRSIMALKIMDLDSEHDRQAAQERLVKMLKRRAITERDVELATQVIELKRQLAAERDQAQAV